VGETMICGKFAVEEVPETCRRLPKGAQDLP
jgi:hypothetical protein